MKLNIVKTLGICVIALMSHAVLAAKEQTVVLISLDGFRWDYIEKHDAPNSQVSFH